MVRALCVWCIIFDLCVIETLWLGRHKDRDGFRAWGDSKRHKRHKLKRGIKHA